MCGSNPVATQAGCGMAYPGVFVRQVVRSGHLGNGRIASSAAGDFEGMVVRKKDQVIPIQDHQGLWVSRKVLV